MSDPAPAVANNRGKYYSPPVELPSSNAQNFFEEARVTQAEEVELRRKFMRFSVDDPDYGAVLNLEGFIRLLQHYEVSPPTHYEAYYYAMDRNRDGKLDFNEFFLGCCAADPSTVHILNSFTGYERSQYTFDFYDLNRNSTLEFTEFARLAADTLSLSVSNPNDEGVRRQAIEKARELGALEDAGNMLHFTCIRFKKFYEYIHTEQLRGTSRLFRFYKSIIKSRKKNSEPEIKGDERAQEQEWEAFLQEVDLGNCSTSADDGSSDDDTTETGSGRNRKANRNSTDALQDGNEKQGRTSTTSTKKKKFDPYFEILPPFIIENSQALTTSLLSSENSTQSHRIASYVTQTLMGDGVIHLLGGTANRFLSKKPFKLLKPNSIEELLQGVVRLFQKEDVILTNLSLLPTKVFGSLHGQLIDLISYFKCYGAPFGELDFGDLSYTQYLFLGDYVDRGSNSLEVVCLLFALKLLYPLNVLLLRGTHENRHINAHLGFRQECESRLGAEDGRRIFDLINVVFEYMPLAASLPSGFFLLQSGIPPSLKKPDQLKGLTKPLIVPHPNEVSAGSKLSDPKTQLTLELFYSSFQSSIAGAIAGGRQSTLIPSLADEEARAENFCRRNDYYSVMKSRLVPKTGAHISGIYQTDAAKDGDKARCARLITVCSCLDVGSAIENEGAMLHIVKDNYERRNCQRIRIRRLTTAIPRKIAKMFRLKNHKKDRGATAGNTGSDFSPSKKYYTEGPAFRRKYQRWPDQQRDLSPQRCIMNDSKERMRYELICSEDGNVPRLDEAVPYLALDTIVSLKPGDAAFEEEPHRESGTFDSDAAYREEAGDKRASSISNAVGAIGGNSGAVGSTTSTMGAAVSSKLGPGQRSSSSGASSTVGSTGKKIFEMAKKIIFEATQNGNITVEDLMGRTRNGVAVETTMPLLHKSWAQGKLSAKNWTDTLNLYYNLKSRFLDKQDKEGNSNSEHLSEQGLTMYLLETTRVTSKTIPRWFRAFNLTNRNGYVTIVDFLWGTIVARPGAVPKSLSVLQIARALAVMRYYSSSEESNELPVLEARDMRLLSSDLGQQIQLSPPVDVYAFVQAKLDPNVFKLALV